MRTVAEIEKAYLEGRFLKRSFNKNCNVVTVAGTAQDLSVQSGNPPAQFYVGSIATATALARSTDGGLDHGPDMPGYKKYLHKLNNLQTVTAGAVPCTLEVHDYLAFYPFIGMDSGIQALTTGISIPRYDPSEGIQMMLIEQNSYVGGATVQITYTNSEGVSGRVTPVITLNSVTNAGTVATQAPATAGTCGQYVALQRGDHGVAYPESIEIITGDVGVLCIVLVKPLATVAIYENTTPCDWDLWHTLGYLPEIRDDAYLNLLLKPAGSASGATIYGNIVTLWKEE
jgi:hypothetical protein